MKGRFWARLRVALLLVACGLYGGAAQAQEAPDLVGLNIAGAGFASGVLPGKHGTNYFFPRKGYFAGWQAKGIRTIRFSIIWERLQPALNGELDSLYAGLLDGTFDEAAIYGMRVILDIHNYGRFRGKVIGTPEVPIAAYQDLMERIARRWGNHQALYAYDIMNEPYGAADAYWPAVAQAGIDAVRRHDRKSLLLIEGRSWSSAARWPRLNDDLLALRDPADKLVFSAHAYIDQNSSGLYKQAPGADFDPMAGVKRVEPFVQWLIEHGRRGHIGEFGVPDDDPRWLEAMDNLLAYLRRHCIPMTYWAAGPSWGKSRISVEPVKGEDKPQWAVLAKYLGQGGCAEIGPLRASP